MDLSKLLPWNWLRKPAPQAAPKGGGLAVRREPEEDGDWPDPDSPECIGYELDRLFDHAFSGFGFNAPHLRAASGCARQFVPPRVRQTSGQGGYLLEADLPGVREEDISLTLKGRTLTLIALRQAWGAATANPDPGRAAYRASFRLEPDTDLDALQASYQAPLLRIAAPRLSSPQPRPQDRE